VKVTTLLDPARRLRVHGVMSLVLHTDVVFNCFILSFCRDHALGLSPPPPPTYGDSSLVMLCKVVIWYSRVY